MKLFNTQYSFGIMSVTLHWLFAILIIGMLVSGIYMVTLSYYHPWYHPLPHYHKLVGIGLIALYCMRTLWHLCTRQPEIDTIYIWEKRAAKLAHLSMLLLSGLLLISGYLIISVDTTAIEWLGLKLPPFNLLGQQQADTAGFWHKWIGYGLVGLISLHVLATLKHQFLDKKRILQKICGF